MSLKNLEKLEAWKAAQGFTVHVYSQIVPILPAEEKWGLAQQLRRSSQSIPANLAEGYGRYYYQEGIHFCYIARGLLEETLSHLDLAHRLSYLPDELFQGIVQEGEHVARLINGYIAYLKRSKQGSDEPGSDRALRESPEPYFADLTEHKSD
jgi:four helix bundle protein